MAPLGLANIGPSDSVRYTAAVAKMLLLCDADSMTSLTDYHTNASGHAADCVSMTE